MPNFVFQFHYGIPFERFVFEVQSGVFQYDGRTIKQFEWGVHFDGLSYGPFSKAGAIGFYRYLIILSCQAEQAEQAETFITNNPNQFTNLLEENELWIENHEQLGYPLITAEDEKYITLFSPAPGHTP